MAKVFQDDYLPVSFMADTDLTAKQYYCATAASTDYYVKVADGGSDPAPVGVIQDDNASNVGEAMSVKTFGFTKAWVAGYAEGGVACAVAFGHFLVAGSDGKLYLSGSDALCNARAMESIASGSAIIHVQWLGSACAYAAS
jgi:hypothetical protein